MTTSSDDQNDRIFKVLDDDGSACAIVDWNRLAKTVDIFFEEPRCSRQFIRHQRIERVTALWSGKDIRTPKRCVWNGGRISYQQEQRLNGQHDGNTVLVEHSIEHSDGAATTGSRRVYTFIAEEAIRFRLGSEDDDIVELFSPIYGCGPSPFATGRLFTYSFTFFVYIDNQRLAALVKNGPDGLVDVNDVIARNIAEPDDFQPLRCV